MFLGLYHIVLYRQDGIKRVSPFDSLIGGTRLISFNSAVSARLFSTSVHTKPSSFINPDFLTEFSDAESCFSLSIRNKRNSKNNVKLVVEPVFQIGLNRKDEGLLKLIKASLECQGGLELPGGKVGRIHTDKNKSFYRVTSVSGLAKIIAHFYKYPLLTKKRKDYLI